MQDAFAYCAELVRSADRDRYLASLFAPAERRDALYALYAFNIEVARVREMAREPLPGEIRLQWWDEVLGGKRDEEAKANPVASALLATIERHHLAATRLIDLVDARRFDLYDEPIAGIADFELYATRTSAAVFALAEQILAGAASDAVASPAGVAYAVAGLLRAFPLHAARRRLYVPTEILAQHGVDRETIFAGRSSDDLNAALADFANLGRRHLGAAHQGVMTLPREALPAFLHLAVVRPTLERPGRGDAYGPNDISPWRRQWLIWRAARNPARIAG